MYAVLKQKHYWQRQQDKYEVGSLQWFICWHRAMFYDQLYHQKVEELDEYISSQEPYEVVQN